MIINFYKGYCGGGSGSGSTEGFWNSAQTKTYVDSADTIIYDSAVTYTDNAVSGLATEEYVQEALSGVSLDGYYTSAQTDAAIAQAVSGKADAKVIIDFDHTSQAERAALYADLYDLYDGGSGATINRNYDFFKTVNTWQGLKIDYYGFSGDTLVFGKVVSPENITDEVVYEQVMTIDSEGNVEVVTNIVGGASGDTDTEILKASNKTAAELEQGDVISIYNPLAITRYGIYTGTTTNFEFTQSGGTEISFWEFYGPEVSGFTEENPLEYGTISYTSRSGNITRVSKMYKLYVYFNSTASTYTTYDISLKIKQVSGETTGSGMEEYVYDVSSTIDPAVINDNTYFYAGISRLGYPKLLIGFPENIPIENLWSKSLNFGFGEEISLKMKVGPNQLAAIAFESDLNAYTPTSRFATINGSAITNGGNIVIQGGNSPIIPAITTQAEYAAISGDVKTGDLIQVYDVDINGDNETEYGLFEAGVQEEESEGVVRKLITWNRRDNSDSVLWSNKDYLWMPDYGLNSIELGENSFIISPDYAAEDEAYNGIGFDADGKPVITHFAPEYDDETGEVTGITRADTPIGGGADMSAYTPTTGFSTINGSAITNGGNIVIQGGGGGGGISQADLASSGYLYYQDDGMGNFETNLDVAYDFLKGNDCDGYSVAPPQLVDYDTYDEGTAGEPPFPKHLVTIYRSDYDDLVNNGNEDSETFYIVLPDPDPGI